MTIISHECRYIYASVNLTFRSDRYSIVHIDRNKTFRVVLSKDVSFFLEQSVDPSSIARFQAPKARFNRRGKKQVKKNPTKAFVKWAFLALPAWQVTVVVQVLVQRFQQHLASTMAKAYVNISGVPGGDQIRTHCTESRSGILRRGKRSTFFERLKRNALRRLHIRDNTLVCHLNGCERL